MAAFAADEFFLDIDEDGPGALGEASYFSFSDEEHQFIHSDIAPGFDIETLTPTPDSPFSFDSDHDHDLSPPLFHMRTAISPSRSPPFWDCLEDDLADNLADHIDDVLDWEEIPDSADDASVPIGAGGAGTATGGEIGGVDPDVFGFFSERDILGVMEGVDSGDESLFSDEPPFNFGDLDDEGQEIDDMFRSVGWEEVIPAALDDEDDEFEVLPGHMVDAAVGGAPPAARAAVERLQVAVVGGEDAAQGCAVCKDGIVQGELATRLPCAHFYHGDCIGPWLAIRNSCPVCRYELPTDDPDYEKQRARRCSAGASVGSPMHI